MIFNFQKIKNLPKIDRTFSAILSEQNIGVVSNNADTLEIKLSRALKDLNSAVFASATGQTVLNPDGLRTYTNNAGDLVAGPSITNKGIDAADTVITNVAAGTADTDAVNVSQLEKAQAAATTKVAAGDNMVVTPTTNTDGTTITKNADGALTVNTTPLTNNTDGSVNTPAAPNAIATAGDVANAISNSGFTLTAQGSNGSLVKPGSTVDMNNTDGNIVISKSASDNKVTYNLAKDIKVDSVTTGNTVVNNSGVTINNADPAKTVSLTENGLNNGGNRITNVAPGEDGTDAVNVNQLNQVNNNVVNLNDKVNRVDRDLRGGIGGAIGVGYQW